MSLLLAFLAQVGPFVTPGAAPVSPLPREMQERRRPPRPVEVPPPPKGRLQDCLARADTEPLAAADLARAWLASAKGSQQVEPNHCLGAALARSGRWQEAEAAFLAGRDATSDDHGLRATMGAMAGNAALAAGAPDRALAALDAALADALAAGDKPLAGFVQLDRARALVASKRPDDASQALEQARASDPGNPEAWLLSATHLRRIGKLAEAQSAIETAARLQPSDPEIGLEAGVIAMLAGREDAARRSWQSVLATAPASEAAATARNYLDQLGPVRAARP